MKTNNHPNIFLRVIITWLLFIPVVFANATLREIVYKPYIGELAAHQLSTIIGSAAFVLVAWLTLRHYLIAASNRKLLTTGLIWLLMTVLFEFGLGRFVTGASWDKLLHDYNLSAGRIWILLLLTEVATPFIVHWLAAKAKKATLQSAH